MREVSWKKKEARLKMNATRWEDRRKGRYKKNAEGGNNDNQKGKRQEPSKTNNKMSPSSIPLNSHQQHAQQANAQTIQKKAETKSSKGKTGGGDERGEGVELWMRRVLLFCVPRIQAFVKWNRKGARSKWNIKQSC